MKIRFAIYRHSGPESSRVAERVSVHSSRVRAERLARHLHIIRSSAETQARVRWSVRNTP